MSSLFEPGSCPFVPVVVYEIRNTDAKERRIKPGIESCYPFPLDDALDGIEEAGVGALSLNLRTSRESNQWVSASTVRIGRKGNKELLREGHREDAPSSPANSMGKVVGLLRGRRGCHCRLEEFSLQLSDLLLNHRDEEGGIMYFRNEMKHCSVSCKSIPFRIPIPMLSVMPRFPGLTLWMHACGEMDRMNVGKVTCMADMMLFLDL